MNTSTQTANGNEPDRNFAILSTVPKRPTVEIDKERYELAMLDYDFSLAEHHQLDRDIEEFDELWAKPKLTKKDGERLKALLESLFDRVTHELPAEVAGKLHDVQKRQVIAVFSFAPQLMRARAEQQEQANKPMPSPSTTAS